MEKKQQNVLDLPIKKLILKKKTRKKTNKTKEENAGYKWK
jgi:hypothetical protein